MELHNLASLTQNLNMTRLFRGVAYESVDWHVFPMIPDLTAINCEIPEKISNLNATRHREARERAPAWFKPPGEISVAEIAVWFGCRCAFRTPISACARRRGHTVEEVTDKQTIEIQMVG